MFTFHERKAGAERARIPVSPRSGRRWSVSTMAVVGAMTASIAWIVLPADAQAAPQYLPSGTYASGSLSPTQTATAGSGYAAAVLTDHPVAFWAMNNPRGTEADLSGNGHRGTYKGGMPALAALPNGDSAADFNGTSEYMTVPSSATLSIPTTKRLSWEAWIRPDVLQFPSAADGYIDWMGKCSRYSPTCEWEARMYSTTNSENRCNRLSAYAFNPTAGLGSGADWQPKCKLLKAGEWLHVVGEYQMLSTPSPCSSRYPGTIDIWVNGVKWNQSYHGDTGCMSQYRVAPTANNSPLNIAVMASEYWFKGSVGKVAIYNYLLTQAQISKHFTAMTGAKPSGSCTNTCTIPVPTP